MISGISIKDVPNDFKLGYGIFIASNASRNGNYGRYVNKTYSWYVTVNEEQQLNKTGDYYRWLAIG